MSNTTTKGSRVDARELIALRLSARNIKLNSRLRVTADVAGGYQSRFRGRGIDFQESRNYQPGDDIRTMDWRVTARTGRAHTKVFQEERERPIIIVVDCNPSMFFGTRVAFKAVIAARFATLIAWASIRNGDRIGAFLFGPEGHHDLAPQGGRSGVMHLIRLLAEWINPERHQGKSIGLDIALQRLRRVVRPGSLVFILSDFYALGESAATESQLARLRQHSDVIACQFVDALELSPPPPGRYGISDGQHTRILDTRRRSERESYSAYFERHHKIIKDLFRKRAVTLLTIATHDDIVDTLRRSFGTA